MGTAHFTKFWSSIINDSGMQDQLKSVMSIEDEEERALQLLTRTLFILVMEIKHERDEANKNLNQLMENIRTCKSCGMMTKFDAHCETRKNADMNCNGLKHQKEVPNLSFPENCMEMETSKKLILVEGDDIASEEGHIAPQLKDPMGLNYSKIKNIKYRCLSRYPKGNSPNIGQEDEENEESIIKSETEEQNIPKILAPETLSLDENEFHVSSSQKRTFETNIVSVPETLAIENTRSIDNECEVVSNEKSNPVLDSRVGIEGELRSPSRNHTGMADSLNQRSPVLGKKTRQATSKSLKQSIRMDFPKALDFEEFNKESHKPVEINTPESKVTKVTSTPKFSPRVFTHSLSTSFNDSDNTSPSLLPPVKTKAIRCNTKENYFPSLPAALNKIENQGQSTSKGRKEFQKSISSYNMPLPSIKPFSLRRHQSVDKQSKRSSYKMSIDPPEVQKNYKQTKISESIFQKKTDVALFTGGVARKGLTFLDDEKAAVSAALEESLKTKAIYDMMRKKQKGLLNAESTCDIKKMKGAHTLIDGVDGQPSRLKLCLSDSSSVFISTNEPGPNFIPSVSWRNKYL
ncbi:uncharacterized protein LOC121856711 isoform X2 [Homarus americanus]|uniref:uncharacterized protein LOC121856711 isoform X2 n=1 Tax=Homarus americanus TaxID=6706 RepID=UPI001C441BE4|nr:uncharacterized protein LOC121856711 isoform X2 [Homarus americanus]